MRQLLELLAVDFSRRKQESKLTWTKFSSLCLTSSLDFSAQAAKILFKLALFLSMWSSTAFLSHWEAARASLMGVGGVTRLSKAGLDQQTKQEREGGRGGRE